MSIELQSVADRLAIREVLDTYCRGLDRMDLELARSVFHPDAPANYHGMYEGTGHGFIDWVWEAHAGMQRHCHQISNVLIELDGDTACSEAYVTVTLWLKPDEQGRVFESLNRGRYLDRWRREAGQWRIAEREHVLDLQTLAQVHPGEQISEASRRDREDASYRFLG